MTKLTEIVNTPAEATAAVAAFLRDMQPVSARLARELEGTHAQLARELAGARDALAHTRTQGHTHAPARHAHGARRREAGWQWGALAACLIAGVALWAARGHVSPLSAGSALAQQRSDEIFTWASNQQLAAQNDRIFRANDLGDRIFHANEDGAHGDRIFDGKFGGG